MLQSFLQSPWCPKDRSAFHLCDPIVPMRLDDLAIDAGGPEDSPDDPFIELESVRGDQSNVSVLCPFPWCLSKKNEKSRTG